MPVDVAAATTASANRAAAPRAHARTALAPTAAARIAIVAIPAIATKPQMHPLQAAGLNYDPSVMPMAEGIFCAESLCIHVVVGLGLLYHMMWFRFQKRVNNDDSRPSDNTNRRDWPKTS